MILNQKGASLLLILTIIAFVSLLAQFNLVSKSLDLQKDWINSTTFTNKNTLVFSLAEDLSNEISLQFSRYKVNSALENCLKGNGDGTGSPCDESVSYDMVLFAPIEQQSFIGGEWPNAPSGALFLAGGKTSNLVLYRSSGSRCPIPSLTAANDFCPLQPIIRFKPLCGGTNDIPNLTIPGGGPCGTKPATGFDITIGVARYMNGTLIYHENIKPGGDAQVFRFSANILRR